jgi:hypothetical protein
MAPIRSAEVMLLECAGCSATYLVPRRATYDELELAETWMETHGRCAFPRFGMTLPRTPRPGGSASWEEFRSTAQAALVRAAAELDLLAVMLDRRGITGADIVREQRATMVGLLTSLRAREAPSYPEGEANAEP